VVRARRVGGQEAAAVSRADLQPREAVQRALEDQMRERYRRVERVANRVRQPAVALQSLREVRGALRMDEDENSELLGSRPERMKLRVRELVPGNARADGGAAQPELLDAVLELLDRQIGKLECDRREGDEAVRVRCAEPSECLVLDLDHLLGDVALRAI